MIELVSMLFDNTSAVSNTTSNGNDISFPGSWNPIATAMLVVEVAIIFNNGIALGM